MCVLYSFPKRNILTSFQTPLRGLPIVYLGDTLEEVRKLMQINPDIVGRVAVMNMASDKVVACGATTGLGTTEEVCLCLSSTLLMTLEAHQGYYPWDDHIHPYEQHRVCGIVSTNIVIFKDTLERGCVLLPASERQEIMVVSVAAPDNPPLTTRHGFRLLARQEDAVEIKEKLRIVLRACVQKRRTVVVLGAMGCGAYGCPPRGVAGLMKYVLKEEEFKGFFELFIFVIKEEAIRDIFADVFKWQNVDA